MRKTALRKMLFGSTAAAALIFLFSGWCRADEQAPAAAAVENAQVETAPAGQKLFSSTFLKTKSSAQQKLAPGSEIPDLGSRASQASKGLIYCVAGVLVLFSLYRHLKLRGSSGVEQNVIELIARKALSSKTALLVVRAEERKFLLTQTGDDVSLLAELDPATGFMDTLTGLSLVDEETGKIAAANG